MVDNQIEGLENVIEEVIEPVQKPSELEENSKEPAEDGQLLPYATEKSEQGQNEFEEDANAKRVNNWRVLRDARDKAERERDEALRQLKGYAGTRDNREKETPDRFELGDDDLAEGKHLKAFKEESNRKLLQMESQLESQLAEQKVRSRFPDFDKVVTPDTLGMLRDEDPELADSILANRNMHSQMVTAYRSIKRLGLYTDDRYAKEKAIVRNNSSKPRPSASVSPQQGDSPLSRANAFADGLTDALKAQLLKEMNDARSNL